MKFSRTLRHYLTGGALVGVFLPVIVLIDHQINAGVFNGSYWILILWPSSFMLMAFHGHRLGSAEFYVVLLSIAINMLLYALIGSVIWFFLRMCKLSSTD